VDTRPPADSYPMENLHSTLFDLSGEAWGNPVKGGPYEPSLPRGVFHCIPVKTIHRSHHTVNFTVLPNSLLRDKRLSFRARGILAMMLSHSDEWETNMTFIESMGIEGREAIQTALRELVELGYLEREKPHTTDGKFDKMVWIWKDSPCVVLPADGKPTSGEPATKKEQGIEEEQKEKKKQRNPSISKPTQEEVEGYAVSIDLPASDGTSMFLKWCGTGWMNGANPIRDWQATIRNWKLNHWLPSQKKNGNGVVKKAKEFGTMW